MVGAGKRLLNDSMCAFFTGWSLAMKSNCTPARRVSSLRRSAFARRRRSRGGPDVLARADVRAFLDTRVLQ